MTKKIIEVVGAIIRKDQKILCALRSEKMSSSGFWEFPGGKIEKNETPFEAIIREIKEEINCDIETEKVFFNDITYEYEHIIVRLITINCIIVNGNPFPNEHEKLLWVEKKDLINLNWLAADISTLEKIIQNH